MSVNGDSSRSPEFTLLTSSFAVGGTSSISVPEKILARITICTATGELPLLSGFTAAVRATQQHYPCLNKEDPVKCRLLVPGEPLSISEELKHGEPASPESQQVEQARCVCARLQLTGYEPALTMGG
ncbi:unnamed protein product [Pleuronectes platessa]|uniref:Uncharacterized protein n=1 Tax=Pleuronectes platessa TaxID=8262 RepID=A0A9N7YYM1_PLEPL|nr:unnamed protein product [Pleuronectes platessa]